MLVEMLLASAEHGPDRQAVSDPLQSFSYGGLVRFADVMRRQIEGATSCPRVGILMPSSCAFAGTLFGALWAGRAAVPLNYLLQPAEIAAVIADAGIDTVISVKHFAPLLDALPIQKRYMEDLPLTTELASAATRTLPPAPKTAPDDLALLL